MIIYEVITNHYGENQIIATTNEGKVWIIPTDPANSDYQAYLNRDNPAQYPTQIPTDGAAQ